MGGERDMEREKEGEMGEKSGREEKGERRVTIVLLVVSV